MISFGIFFCALTFLAQGAAAAGRELPDTEFWQVGISAFQGKNLSSENQYLTHSMPLMIKEGLEAIESHYFAGEELEGYRRALIRREQRRLGQELSALRKEKDELFFTKLHRSAREDRESAYDGLIQETIDALKALKSISPEEVSFPEVKPVFFKSGEQSGLLLESPQFSPLRLARQEEVDLLIWGYFEEIQGYLYFEVKALDAVLEREVYAYSDAVVREELRDRFEAAVNGLARVVLGREWASLRISPEPEESALYVDDEYVGRGDRVIDYLLPGERSLKVVYPGFYEKVVTLKLEAGKFYHRELVLEPISMDKILLSSDPPGAMVYQDSIWLGSTPLQVNTPLEQHRLLFRREGYADYPLYLNRGAGEAVFITLQPDLLDPQEVQKKRRNSFYASFGFFALTLPLPIFFYGMAGDYAMGVQQAQAADNMAEAMEFLATGNLFYYAYLGTLALSTSLFINMMINLIRYIGSADRKAG